MLFDISKLFLTFLSLIGLITIGVMHCCWQIGQGWDVGGADNVAIAANNLKALGGKVGVYGYKCEQISCHDDTEIVLCNDVANGSMKNAYYINPDAPYLASYAEDILRDCYLYQWFGDHREWFSCGQYFDTDHYNVIVRRPQNQYGRCL
ncbi:hypothetical protein HYALB_00012108 [Hymenoscyphus albidus]|uniref:Uncharacterized protein n=1 Tax=Hymenoscyphus albidus TaxID=595503 RepID=A0A9N9Q071_9HELO|nr:hypothetical protein HYALB_00012108 [Hymenoscyphus albidus]